VSPSDQTVEIRLTLSREEAVAFLENLAEDADLRDRFESNPREVLTEHGIEVSPDEAIPSTAVAPDPDDIRSAIGALSPPTTESPWNAMFRAAPYVGLLAKPEEPGGSESA
jgi:hypothetical protein